MLVATATDAELDGDLDLLVDELGGVWFEYFSGGLDCRVRWFHPDDADDREVKRCGRIARRECLAAFRKAGIRMPCTVRELAWVMADLGILTTEAGRSRWRWPEWPPLPEEVLPVSRAFRKAEDARRWSSMHAEIAHDIIELLADRPRTCRPSRRSSRWRRGPASRNCPCAQAWRSCWPRAWRPTPTLRRKLSI